jgi:Bacteriophage lambda head decoration protein D
MAIDTFFDGTTPGIAGSATDTVTSNFLFVGETPDGSQTETYLAPLADVKPFTPVGRITATGKITQSDPAATDGSQNPIGVTVARIFAGADQGVDMWIEGSFNDSALNWHAGFLAQTFAVRRLAFNAKQPAIIVKQPNL